MRRWHVQPTPRTAAVCAGAQHAEQRVSSVICIHWCFTSRYRATVLAAFQEVEDALSLTRRLQIEVVQQHAASERAAEALSISTTLYGAGLDNYLSVAVAQVAQLTARTSEVQVQVRQMQAAVSLIRALGGGWTDQRLPIEKQTLPSGTLGFGHADSM